MKGLFFVLFACLCSCLNAGHTTIKCTKLLPTTISFFEKQIQEEIIFAEATLEAYKEELENKFHTDEDIQKLLKKINKLEKEIEKLKKSLITIDAPESQLND